MNSTRIPALLLLLLMTGFAGDACLAVEGAAAGGKSQSTLRPENTPLMQAIKAGDLKDVRKLIKDGADVNVRMFNGYTPLHMAAENDRPKIARELIKKGADVNAEMAEAGFTPLYIAAERGYMDVIKELLRGKAKVGFQPAAAAVSAGRNEVVETLLAHGASIDGKGPKGITLLHVAAQSGQIEMAEWLIAHGAQVNSKDQMGNTPLSIAAGNVKMENMLRAHGAKGEAVLDFNTAMGLAGRAFAQNKFHEAVAKYELASQALKPDSKDYGRNRLMVLYGLTLSYLANKERDKGRAAAVDYIASYDPKYGVSTMNLAEMHKIMAGLEFEAKNYKNAERHYEKIIDITARNTGPGAPLLIQEISNLGMVYMYAEDFKAAEGTFRRALSVYEKNPNPQRDTRISLELQVGHMLRRQHKYDQARKMYTKIRTELSKVDRTAPEDNMLNGVLFNLAMVARETGDYHEAVELYEAVRRSMEEGGATGDPRYAAILKEIEEVKRQIPEPGKGSKPK